MKYFFIIISFFFIGEMATYASEKIVEEFGPCWASHQKGFPLQIASFSSGVSYQMEQEDFLKIINTFKEETQHLNLSSFVVQNISAHCGAYGHALFVTLMMQNAQAEKIFYCLKLAHKTGKESWHMDWGIDPYYQKEGVCFGVLKGELLLNVKELGADWKAILASEKLQDIIESEEEVNSDWVKITLKEKWKGQVSQAKSAILKILDKKSPDLLEFLHWIQPVGEYYSFPFKK